MEIKIRAQSVDGITWNKTYKTIEGARRFLDDRVGANPETGRDYLVSPDGIVTASVEGISIPELYVAGTPAVEQWECDAGQEYEFCSNAGCEPCRSEMSDRMASESRAENAWLHAAEQGSPEMVFTMGGIWMEAEHYYA